MYLLHPVQAFGLSLAAAGAGGSRAEKSSRLGRQSDTGRVIENAGLLAAFLNRTKPERVINFSLFLYENAPLYQDILSKRFTPADELENLLGARRLIELLDVDNMEYDGFHD